MLNGTGLLMAVLVPLIASTLGMPMSQKGTPSFTFAGVGYYPRYAKGNLHEFTPKDQPNLKIWTDMVTINDYLQVVDGEGLAKAANSVLETYKENKAVVVKTNSVPRTPTKEAEHLIVVLFPKQDFIEASFARLLMDKGKGTSIVYSHRIYGKAAGDAMSKWLAKYGDTREKALMSMRSVPKRK